MLLKWLRVVLHSLSLSLLFRRVQRTEDDSVDVGDDERHVEAVHHERVDAQSDCQEEGSQHTEKVKHASDMRPGTSEGMTISRMRVAVPS